MPELETTQYYQKYRITDLFVRDLKITLGDLAYVDAEKFIKKIDECDRIMSIAQLEEFINELHELPYRIVSRLISVISVQDNFVKYFEPLPLDMKQEVKVVNAGN